LKIQHKILLFLFALAQTTVVFAQDFWTMTNCPDTVGYYCTATTSDGVLFAGTNLGAYRSYDNGETWELVITTNFIDPIYITNENRIYAGCYPSHIFYSDDYGTTWDTIDTPAYTSKSFLLKPTEMEILYGGWQGVYKSADHGETWNLVFPSTNNNTKINDMAIHPNGDLFTCNMCPHDTTGCGVYISKDNGNTWKRTTMSNQEYIVSLEVNSKGDIFAGSRGHYSLGRGAVLKSSDMGQSWTIIKDDNILVNTITIAQNDDVYIGCSTQDWFGGGVYRSSNNGLTWEKLDSGIVSIPDVKHLWYDNTGYIYSVIGETTKIYRSYNLFTEIDHNEFATGDFSVFPNPFSDKLIVTCETMNSNDDIEINIFDINGHCIYNNKTSGEKTNINTSLWAKGVYFILSKNNSKFNSYKIIKK